MFFDIVALALNAGCTVYSIRLAALTGRRVEALERELVERREVVPDVLSHNERVLEANELWEMCRTLGPRAAKLGGLVGVAQLFASVGSLARTGTLIFLGMALLLGGSGYAYTRASFRRNESRLRKLRDQIRKAARPSEF